jgi:hypothetical protein
VADDARDGPVDPGVGGGSDPLGLFDAMLPMLEMLRGQVAVLRREGFTDAQARDIVTAVLRTSGQQPSAEASDDD